MRATGSRLTTNRRSRVGITARRISSTPAATSSRPKVKVPTRRTFLGGWDTGFGAGGTVWRAVWLASALYFSSIMIHLVL